MSNQPPRTTGMTNRVSTSSIAIDLDLDQMILDIIISDKVQVPPYPAIAAKISQLLTSGKFSVSELARQVAADQVLAASILKHANSAYYRGNDEVIALDRAIMRIGTDELVRTVMALSIGNEACRPGPLAELKRRIWQDALISGIFCHQVAKWLRWDADQAFMCGLLHDFGRTMTLRCVEDILRSHPNMQAKPEQYWLDLIAKHHVELGMVTAAKWNLPEAISTCIAAHHQLDLAGDHTQLVSLIALSDTIGLRMRENSCITEQQLADLPELADPRLRTFVAAVLPRIPELVQGMESVPEEQPVKNTRSGPVAAAHKNVVDRPPTALSTTTWPFSLEIVHHTKKRDVPYKGLYLNHKGFGFAGSVALPTQSLARFKFVPENSETPPLDMWANIVSIAHEGATYRIEATPFGLGGDAEKVWTMMWQRARDAANAANDDK